MCGGGQTHKATPAPQANAKPVPRTEPNQSITYQGESVSEGSATQLTGLSADSSSFRKRLRM